MKMIMTLLSLLCLSQALASETSSPPSFGSMGITKKIFGSYLRNQIEDATEFPLRTIGQIETGCTGTLIGPKHVLTAGHCVYDTFDYTWSYDLNFFPGRLGASIFSFGVAKWKRVFIQKEYLETGDTEYDFAVIELEESIGDVLGWSGLKVFSEPVSPKNNIRIIGYPVDKDEGTMWSVYCPYSYDATMIYYHCDTFGGMSGSGIFPSVPTPREAYISAVHTYGNKVTNGGVLIGIKNYSLIKSWIGGKEYSYNTVIRDRSGKTEGNLLLFK